MVLALETLTPVVAVVHVLAPHALPDARRLVVEPGNARLELLARPLDGRKEWQADRSARWEHRDGDAEARHHDRRLLRLAHVADAISA